MIKHVTQVKGISRWAAQTLLIIGLGRPDVLPIDDLGLQDAITERYRGVSRWQWRGGRDELVHLAEPWRPYRTFGTWYLWRGYGLPWGFSGGARMGGVRRTWASFHQR